MLKNASIEAVVLFTVFGTVCVCVLVYVRMCAY